GQERRQGEGQAREEGREEGRQEEEVRNGRSHPVGPEIKRETKSPGSQDSGFFAARHAHRPPPCSHPIRGRWNYPFSMSGFSKTRIDRLGERLREGAPSDDDLRLLDDYRCGFKAVFEEAQRRL